MIINMSHAAHTFADSKKGPFSSGEKLTYRLRWGPITAGTATLKVKPIETYNGREVYHFVMKVKSSKYIDTIYKVRSRIDAYTDTDMTHSVLYKKDQKEGRHKRKIIVTFNWDKNEAQYTNFGKKKNPISILPGSFDPLSVMYYIRLQKLKAGSEIKCPVTDGKKNVIGIANVIKKETVKSAGKEYESFLLEPELKDVGGVFKKSKDAKLHIWISADKRKIPVKLKSKVIIGSFVGELISIE